MLTPWKESYNQPRQHIEKQRHYFAKTVRLVKAMVFPVVMYGYECWTIKKAERQEKVGLKLNIQKTKIMASGPTTSWEIDGETVAHCNTLYLLYFVVFASLPFFYHCHNCRLACTVSFP